MSLGWSPTGICHAVSKHLSAYRATPSSHTHLRQTRQIHQGEIEYIGTVYPQVNGELADALVLARDAERLLLNLAANLVEVGVAFVYVEELAPFRDVRVAFGGWGVDELEDERSVGDDAGAAGEEVAADDAIRVALEFSAGGGEMGRWTHVSMTLDFPADWLPT